MADPVRLSHETIYTTLYAMPRAAGRCAVSDAPGAQGAAMWPNQGYRRSKSIPDIVLIDQRLAEVAARAVPGHWEGDLTAGKRNMSQVSCASYPEFMKSPA